jgi:FkbM family methyltransferase
MNMMVNQLEAERFKTLNANGHLIHYDELAAGWRYATLLEKEPETIEWIDGFEAGDTLWDVGANIGIYSVYAGVKGIRTFAFEPHFANYHQLCASIALNNLQDEITPLCLAFAESKSVGELNLASIDVGTSMSNFGEAVDFRGKPYKPAFRQGMIGYDIDSFIADFGLEVPNHLKIDVDGIELPIVKGARATLANPKLQSVSIELIETDTAQVDAVTEILEAAGLHFIHKKQNAVFATPETRDVKNYLFHRDPAKLEQVTSERVNLAALTVGDHGGDLTTGDLVARIVAKIQTAALDTEPCGNLYAEGLFPPAIYHELVARLPADPVLDPIVHPDAINANGRVTRYLLDLTPDSLERFAAEDRPFWEAMMTVFTDPALAQAIVAKFAPWLHERFGDTLPELVAVPLFYRDFPGYRIGIHPDAEFKIATMQFYLPADETQRHLGTVFHKQGANGFERLKANDFKPNAAYAFVRTDESWHSVDELGPNEAPRNSIALTFYIKGQEYRSKSKDDTMSLEAPAAPVALAPVAAPVAAPAPAAVLHGAYDEQIAQALRSLAQTFTRRDDVATLFRDGGIGIELGVAAGDFSERILTRSTCEHLYSVDMWAGDRGHGVDQYREAIIRLAPYRTRNSILRMRFDEALALFDESSLDFIYVDGYAHDGELNGQTFREWFPKLRAGGIMAGDDYHADWPLVVTAVDKFVADNRLELHIIQCSEDSWNSKYPTWFAMKP